MSGIRHKEAIWTLGHGYVVDFPMQTILKYTLLPYIYLFRSSNNNDDDDDGHRAILDRTEKIVFKKPEQCNEKH